MLFMGSEKYPEENAYDAYVSSHGGYCNAFTEVEYTVYQFEVQPEAFEGALDIFANCFKSPLLAVSAMDREVQAIENEFNLALNDDESRLQQLLSHYSSPGHPYGVFTWGNRKSLKELPESHGVNMNDVLKEFHKTYYYPANMKLVLVGPFSIGELKDMAIKCFDMSPAAPTPSSPLYVNPSLDFKPPLPDSALGRFSKIPAHRKGHRLHILWQLPPLLRQQSVKPAAYLAHLLGHEGPGSLMSYLQQHSLAQGLMAGVSEGGLENSSLASLFVINIKLTKLGLKNWPTIVQRVLQYIEMIKTIGIQQWVFDEIRDMANVSFSKSDSMLEHVRVTNGLFAIL